MNKRKEVWGEDDQKKKKTNREALGSSANIG